MSPPLTTGLFRRWEYYSRTENSQLTKKKKAPLRLCLCQTFNGLHETVELRAFQQLLDKKGVCITVKRVCNHFNTVFGSVESSHQYCLCQQARPSFKNLKTRSDRRRCSQTR